MGRGLVCMKLKIGGLPLFKPLCRRGLRRGFVVGEFWVGSGFLKNCIGLDEPDHWLTAKEKANKSFNIRPIF